MNKIDTTFKHIIPASPYQAILIGGPPCAGKSVLTYSLTRELRRHEIPHFVFRASPDGEGDWFLHGNGETVRQIRQKAKGKWSPAFRTSICHDLAHRQLPLIVDMGGMPQDADASILQLCTHSILLLKDDEPQAAETWRRITTNNGLQPIAELRSQLNTRSIITGRSPILTGIIGDLVREKPIRERANDSVFNALFQLVEQLFHSYPAEEIETSHLNNAPIEVVVNLKDKLHDLASDTNEWSFDLLPPLLSSLPPHTEMAIYGRAPVWVYGALAMHAYPQPFHQFDACIGWVHPQMLQVGEPKQQSDQIIELHLQQRDDAWLMHIHPLYYYLDYSEADQLMFPELSADKGVILSGKLPFWLFTSLARFYADRQVPWIAMHDAANSQPIVVYSRVASHYSGQVLPNFT